VSQHKSMPSVNVLRRKALCDKILGTLVLSTMLSAVQMPPSDTTIRNNWIKNIKSPEQIVRKLVNKSVSKLAKLFDCDSYAVSGHYPVYSTPMKEVHTWCFGPWKMKAKRVGENYSMLGFGQRNSSSQFRLKNYRRSPEWRTNVDVFAHPLYGESSQAR